MGEETRGWAGAGSESTRPWGRTRWPCPPQSKCRPKSGPWGARTTQDLSILRTSLKPAHPQPSTTHPHPAGMKLAGGWQNWTWTREGDPGQKLGLPEAPTLSLMGVWVAEKVAQTKAPATQSGSESASPKS